MSKKGKLVERFLSMPTDFHYDEMVRLLVYHGFREIEKGKTGGSRVRFMNDEGTPIYMHKPHPNGIMKRYQLKQVKEIIGL